MNDYIIIPLKIDLKSYLIIPFQIIRVMIQATLTDVRCFGCVMCTSREQ